MDTEVWVVFNDSKGLLIMNQTVYSFGVTQGILDDMKVSQDLRGFRKLSN